MNNFVMRRAGTSEPWSQRIPSGEGTLTGSTQFEVKPTANNNATFDLTGVLEVQLVNSSKRLECYLRQRGHYQADEDPGKQYHFYFRGKADTDQNIFVGIESDGRLLASINATNQDIADYQTKVSGGGSLARTAEIYVDIFSYYLQGTKDSYGQYVFVDTAANRTMVPLSISNFPEWLRLDRLVELTGITDGGVPNCTCYRATFVCNQLTNFNEIYDPDTTSQDWLTRFPLNIPDNLYRGVPRNKTVRVQPQFGNQKEINFKQYGGYRQNLIYGKQLELNASELAQASTGFYQLIVDNSGSMGQYNKSTLQRLPKIDFHYTKSGIYTVNMPSIDFVFKLGTSPTNTAYEDEGVNYIDYIGYPWVISGLHIINTVQFGDNMYKPMSPGGFYDVVNEITDLGTWVYVQSNVVKQKLAINGTPMTYFYVDVISLNDLYDLGYIDQPSRRFGTSHTERSPRDQEQTVPYINIPTIIGGKRSLTAKECQGYYQWITNLVADWKNKMHPTTLEDELLGNSAGTYLLVPRIAIISTDGIGSDGSPRINEWITVESCDLISGTTYDVTNADPALSGLRWEPEHISDYTNGFDQTYDDAIGFRFKIIN